MIKVHEDLSSENLKTTTLVDRSHHYTSEVVVSDGVPMTETTDLRPAVILSEFNSEVVSTAQGRRSHVSVEAMRTFGTTETTNGFQVLSSSELPNEFTSKVETPETEGVHVSQCISNDRHKVFI